MKERIIILFSLLNFIFVSPEYLECGDENIDNCIKCDEGKNSDTCSKCQPNHFLFFNNLLCLPCDDEIYGQVGCGGNCDGKRYNETGFAFCEENGCKEGYYNLNGICFSCLDVSPNCKKCSVEIGENETEIFKCEECISKEFKISEEFGICERCNMEYCLKCHFTEDYSNTECDECIENYYLNSEKKCKPCKIVNITNGECIVCSDNNTDYSSGPCWCNKYYYTKKDHSTCVSCPPFCASCNYNNETQKSECIRCRIGFTLNQKKTCSSCGYGCDFCYLDSELNPICTLCSSNTFLSDNKTCLICPNYCDNCILDEYNQTKCIKCYDNTIMLQDGTCTPCTSRCLECYLKDNNKPGCRKCYENYYVLTPNETCIDCKYINEIGGKGCSRCGNNNLTGKYECYECYKDYDRINRTYIENYAYINNTFQCLDNTDPNHKYLYGCLSAIYIQDKDIYECNSCKNDFIVVRNKKVCRKPEQINLYNCYEAEDIGDDQNPKYSCINCHYNSARITDTQNITQCYSRSNELVFCYKGVKDENNKLQCKECVDNSHINNNNICECNSDSFGTFNEWCDKCDDKDYGNPGCVASEGCIYYHSDDRLDCNKCKSDYFSYTKGQCFPCSEEIENCNQCHYDNLTEKLICDNCRDDDIKHNFLNKEKNKCEFKHCEEYIEIAPGCLICDDKLEEYKSQNKCQSCKMGYFKTKNDSCIYCRSEKYGGPYCFECEYEKDENLHETENIKCKLCPSYYHALNSDGKCYSCRTFNSYGCELCTFEKNEFDNTEKLVCLKCRGGYYLNNDRICVSFIPLIKQIPHCTRHDFYIDNVDISYYASDYVIPSEVINNYPREMNSQIDTKCFTCEDRYFRDDNFNCEPLSTKKCTLMSISNIRDIDTYKCRKYCRIEDNYALIDVTYTNNSINYNNIETKNNNTIKISLFNYNLYDLEKIDENLKSLIMERQICISNSGKGGKEEPENLRRCSRCNYLEKNDSYVCTECIKGYILDDKTNLCKQDIKKEELDNCYLENIGDELNKIYSCKRCYNNYDILISIESGAKFCMEPFGELEGCKEAIANTTFINNQYNCIACDLNYISYYSKFYNRKICQNISSKIMKEKDISFEKCES